MIYEKNIVVLANSRKMSGRCIAGKTITNGECEWIRPVSERDKGEISEEEQRFSNGSYPQLLDIISITFKKPILNDEYKYQTENHLIENRTHWKKTGEEIWDNLDKIKDDPDILWNSGDSSQKGENDRISEDKALNLENSLFLIYVPSIEILLLDSEGKRQIRAEFTYKEHNYNLSITDPRVESHFFKKFDFPEAPISERTLVERRIEAREEWEALKEEKDFLMIGLEERIQGIKKQADLKYAQYKSSEYSNDYKLKSEAVKLYDEVRRLEKEPEKLDKEINLAKEKWDRLKEIDSNTELKAEVKTSNKNYLLNNLYLCISIGEPFQGYCYKLVAGLITNPLF